MTRTEGRFRGFSLLCLAAPGLLALVGCGASSGTGDSTQEIIISPALSATPADPNTQTPATLSFGLAGNHRWQDGGVAVGYVLTQTDRSGASTPIREGALVPGRSRVVSIEIPSPVSDYNNGTDVAVKGPFTYRVELLDHPGRSSSTQVNWADLNLAFSPSPSVSSDSGQAVITATVACADVTGGVITATARAVRVIVTTLDGTPITPDSIVATSPAGTYPVDLGAGASQTYTITLPTTVTSGTSVRVTIDPEWAVPESTHSDNAITLVLP